MIEEIRKVKDGCIIKLDGKGGTNYCFDCRSFGEVQCIQKELFKILEDLQSNPEKDVIIS